MKPDHTVDLIVVGSGCAGLSSALVAAKQGLKVLVLEKSNFFGGTTAYSGGGAWIPANKHQPSVGITDDSLEKADVYLKRVVGDLYNPSLVRAFLEAGPKMVDWMEENTAMRFKPVLLPDYHEKQPGSSIARTLLTREFDASVLGRDRLREVRYTLQGYHAFGSMQADPSELACLAHPFSTFANITATARKVFRYAWDLVRYSKGAVVANGNALVARLLYSCTQNPSSITLWKNSPVVKTLLDGERRVVGAVVRQKNGVERTVNARRGVILASGGFGRHPDAHKILRHDWTVQPRHNVGDGLRMATESGGVLPPQNPDNGIYAPISLLHKRDGQVRRYPHFGVDRCKPGSVIVGPDGRRFENESAPYQEFVKKMHGLSIKKAFFIGDANFLRRYGMGMALPGPLPTRHLVKQGYLIRAKTLDELARKIEVDADTLKATISECNENAQRGVDPAFGRGETKYDRSYGDASRGLKNPNLGPCERAPFYAVPLYPGNVSTVYGVSTDENARVLNADGKPVEGLYAVGLDQNSVMRGTYPGGGSSIGPGMTFGFRAAMHAAGKPLQP